MTTLNDIYVTVDGWKLEIGNWGEMKRVYELDVYKVAEELSDKGRGNK